MNGSLLRNIKIQEMHKEHALNILKYIQIFLHHLTIIKNKYNVITKMNTLELNYPDEEEKLQAGWNKYENEATLINLDNEYSPLYKLLGNIKKEEPETIKYLTETLRGCLNLTTTGQDNSTTSVLLLAIYPMSKKFVGTGFTPAPI